MNPNQGRTIVRNEKRETIEWRRTTWVAPGPSRKNEAKSICLSPASMPWFEAARMTSGFSWNEFVRSWLRLPYKCRVSLQSKKTDPWFKISVDLKLSAFVDEVDPILLSKAHLDERGVSLGTFLRGLYLELLKENDLCTTSAVVAAQKIDAIKHWKPYVWPNRRPLVQTDSKAKQLSSFFFLLKDEENRTKINTHIRFRKNNDEADIVKATLPLICTQFRCSAPDFFKLLYVSFLRYHDAVNADGVVENAHTFMERISTIDFSSYNIE